MIDYLQLMASGSNFENRVQEVSQISRSLKVLAGDLEVPGARVVAALPRRGEPNRQAAACSAIFAKADRSSRTQTS